MPKPQPHLLDIAPYIGGRSSLPGIERPIKLSGNEGALGPSPRALDAYRKAADAIGHYPDGGCVELREAIGRRHGLDPERIVCGAGSDELLAMLARAYSGPGDETLYTEHGFLMWPIVARAAGGQPVKVPERRLTADIDALIARVDRRTRIVYLANPNNPTGTYLAADELRRLRAGIAADVLLVLDAAYGEYVARNDYTPGTELVDAGDNVVMTRTFSKIYGLSALRLGWAYCPPEIADILNRVRMPFNVNAPSQAAGIAALEDSAHVAANLAHNEEWRGWLTARLAEIGLEIHPSVGNFILVDFAGRGKNVAEAADKFMNARGLIPRRVDRYGLPDCLRITIGLESEMRAVADALADFVAGK